MSRIAELEARPAAAAPATSSRTLDDALDEILRRGAGGPEELRAAIVDSAPLRAALDRIVRGGGEAALPALRLLGELPGRDLAAQRALLDEGMIPAGATALRAVWLAGWHAALEREGADPVVASRTLPADLRRGLVELLLAREPGSEAALAIALELGRAEAPGLELLGAVGRRGEVLRRLAEDVETSLASPTLRGVLLADTDALSDLVEMASTRPELADAIRGRADNWLADALAARDIEGLARLVVELGILRGRDGAEAESAWAAIEKLDDARAMLAGLDRGRLDLEDDPETICLLRPRCLPVAGETGPDLDRITGASRAEDLEAALAGLGTSRRRRLAALARGLEAGLRQGRDGRLLVRALRDDGHELVLAFLLARLDRVDAEEAAEVAIWALARGRSEARGWLEARLDHDPALRPGLVARLLAAGPETQAIAWRVADGDDLAAQRQLLLVCARDGLVMPQTVVGSLLRSLLIDPQAGDLAMRVFRASLGDDLRGLELEALSDPLTARPDVLLEDFALPRDDKLLPVILRCLDAGEARLRASALRVLCHYDLRGQVDRLTAFLRDDDAMVRVQLARCLGAVDDEVAGGLLMTLTRDTSYFVREAATRALGRRAGERVRPFLRERLTDGAAEVRIAAAESLVDLGEQDAVPLLIAMLDEPVLGLFVQLDLERRFGRKAEDVASWLAWWREDGSLER